MREAIVQCFHMAMSGDGEGRRQQPRVCLYSILDIGRDKGDLSLTIGTSPAGQPTEHQRLILRQFALTPSETSQVPAAAVSHLAGNNCQPIHSFLCPLNNAQSVPTTRRITGRALGKLHTGAREGSLGSWLPRSMFLNKTTKKVFY